MHFVHGTNREERVLTVCLGALFRREAGGSSTLLVEIAGNWIALEAEYDAQNNCCPREGYQLWLYHLVTVCKKRCGLVEGGKGEQLGFLYSGWH